MPNIHPTAIIDSAVQLAEDVEIGPYCVVIGHVTIGAGTKLVAQVHVTATGKTSIGESCVIYPFASLGTPPQDLKFKGEASELIIGNDNQIREYVTINPGTEGGGNITRIGHKCLLMVGAHVAHDCKLGNQVILANNATLAGHVQVGDDVIIGGLSAVHQFVRIGRQAVIGGMSGVEHDVIPFGSVMGERANLAGLNLVGLKRRGFSREAIHALRNSYKQLFEDQTGTLAERVEQLNSEALPLEVKELLEFIRAKSMRSLCVPANIADSGA